MTDVPPLSPPPDAAPSGPVRSGGSSFGRGLKLLLAVSLALNLAVAGVVAGAVLRGHGEGRPGPGAVRDLNFGPFSEALTRDQRRALLRDVGARGPGLREMRAQMGRDFDAVVAAVRADPFDPAALRTAMEGQSARIAARAEAGREALIGLIAGMSQADRAAFVDRLEAAVAKRGARGDQGRP